MLKWVFGGRPSFFFCRTLLPEQRAKPVYQMLLRLFVIGWHTILPLWTHEVVLAGRLFRLGNKKTEMPCMYYHIWLSIFRLILLVCL